MFGDISSGQRPLILASASPRRRELIGYLGVPSRAVATDAEDQAIFPPEVLRAALPATALPLASHPTVLAWRKADAACREFPEHVIIGADTIVVLDGAVLGKPKDAAHAKQMLRQLAGRTHTVLTGLAVIDPAGNVRFDLAASDVTFVSLTDDEIAAYVATGEPLDKAGAYGVQGPGGRLVREVVGSFTNVVGLPLTALYGLLLAAGVRDIADPSDAYLRWFAAQGKEPRPCPPTLP